MPGPNITITKKARGTGQFKLNTPTNTTVVSILSDGKLSLFGGLGNTQGPVIINAVDAATVIVQLNLLLTYLRSRGDIAP